MKSRKKKSFKKIRLLKKYNLEREVNKKDIDLLREAWENLPEDVSSDERVIFMEIAEKVVKDFKKTNYSVDEEKEIN